MPLDHFWKAARMKYERISLLYDVICGFSVSNGDVERHFSQCKIYVYWKRNRGSVESIRTRLCAKNKKMTDEILKKMIEHK